MEDSKIKKIELLKNKFIKVVNDCRKEIDSGLDSSEYRIYYCDAHSVIIQILSDDSTVHDKHRFNDNLKNLLGGLNIENRYTLALDFSRNANTNNESYTNMFNCGVPFHCGALDAYGIIHAELCNV